MLLPLFFFFKHLFLWGRAKYQLITWNYMKLSCIPSQLWGSTNSLSLSSPAGLRHCRWERGRSAQGSASWLQQPRANGEIARKVQSCRAISMEDMTSRMMSKFVRYWEIQLLCRRLLPKHLHFKDIFKVDVSTRWCKYPFVTMMSQLFAQQKTTNPHGGAANHQVLRSPKGCGSVEIAGASQGRWQNDLQTVQNDHPTARCTLSNCAFRRKPCYWITELA